MARPILIAGESGSGKSRSTKTLDPKQTFIINVSGKDLPYKEGNKNYTEWSKDNPAGNLLITDDPATIIKTIQYISDKRPEVKNLIIDDNQYIGSFEYFRRAYEKDFYQKYTDIGVNMFNIIMAAKNARKDLKVFVLNHIERSEDLNGFSKIKAKTLGKVIDNKLTYEGLFTIVLGTEIEETNGKLEYFFITQSNGNTTYKSPEGMFESFKIPNDLQLVADTIDKYYE